jgi:ornithine decarboxylase
MTPKIARFLAEQQPATPCLVLDVDRVEANFRALQRALPLARIYYAVKANPARPVLERLVRLGSSFDAASFEEVPLLPTQARAGPGDRSAIQSRRRLRYVRPFSAA